MRVRRASTHARRPSPARSTPTLAVVGLVCTALAASGAPATAAPPSSSAPEPADPTPAPKVVATDASGLRVTDTAIPAVPDADAAQIAASARLPRRLTGRLVAHLRTSAMQRFSMLGVTWESARSTTPVTVEVRTSSAAGWGPWTKLDQDPDGPAAAGHAGLPDGTAPVWVGPSLGVEVAVYSQARRLSGLQVTTIDPGRTPLSYGSRDEKGSLDTGRAGSFPGMPTIITRKQWGADPRLGDTCWDPRYGRTFKAVIVHHTAGSNDYTRRESAAIVRGILAYHTQARGWCDIGYNFLVDRFGQIFEGRAGGIRRPVRGAHAGDYNVNTTGISLMGNFDTAYPSARMKAALVRLIAWRLGTAYHGARGRPFVYDRHIRRISGHRDVMSTACPGQHVYDWLPRLRTLVAQRIGDWQSPVERRWEHDGGMRGPLGVVRVGEQLTDHGRFTVFSGGRVFDSKGGLRTMYNGPLLSAYVRSGGTAGVLRYPDSKAWRPHGTHGLARAFQGGRIYYSPSTGAKVLHSGPVLRRYRSVGGATGRLRFPTSRVIDLAHGSRATFQGGSIRHSTVTHSTTVRYR